MNRLRHLSRHRLYAVAATVALLAASAGLAQAALKGSDHKPPAKPLSAAVLDALRAPKLEGISARIHFTNSLLPGGTLPPGVSSPLAAGADGRLWLTADGRFRLDLTSRAGEAQLTSDGERLSIYDGTSQTLYTLPLPAGLPTRRSGAGGFALKGIQGNLGSLLRYFTISGAKPSTTAGRPTYTVRISPRDDGGLLGAAELAWDAEKGVPLRAAVYAQGNEDPILELEATKVSYGRGPASAVAATPHPGAKHVEIDSTDLHAPDTSTNVEGVDAVRRHLDFDLAAPAVLAGLPRREVRLVTSGARKGGVAIYGHGLSTIAVFQTKAAGGGSPLDHVGPALPEVNIDGVTGRELATALGTLVSFERGGVSYVVVGLVPPLAAENAARDLK
jgi:outer membrane lipoprotein-sorting protein